MKKHSLIQTFFSLRGNQRGCIYTEPLWAIPYNLYAAYASVYMVALGLSDRQIGLIVGLSWGVQVILALLSGVITDRLGRRRTTFIFDFLAWSIPALISAAAQDFWYFLAAALFNSAWRITYNSWQCLLAEDAAPDQLVDIYTWANIVEEVPGLIAPLAGLLIAALGLIPAMRGIYFFAACLFAVKFIACYHLTRETAQGVMRMRETRSQSLLHGVAGYKSLLCTLLHTPKTLTLAAILLVMQITWMISGSFWGIIVTQKLSIPAASLAFFPFVRSAIMLFFFFALNPLINRLPFRLPLVLGFLGSALSQVLLVAAPVEGYPLLILSAILETCSFTAIGPLMDKLTILAVDAGERARTQAIISVSIILLTAPFGWIAGMLSEMDRGLPFLLNIGLYAAGAWLVYRLSAVFKDASAEKLTEPQAA